MLAFIGDSTSKLDLKVNISKITWWRTMVAESQLLDVPHGLARDYRVANTERESINKKGTCH